MDILFIPHASALGKAGYIKIALGIRNYQLGSFWLVLTQANHCNKFCIPNIPTCPIAKAQSNLYFFESVVIYSCTHSICFIAY